MGKVKALSNQLVFIEIGCRLAEITTSLYFSVERGNLLCNRYLEGDLLGLLEAFLISVKRLFSL